MTRFSFLLILVILSSIILRKKFYINLAIGSIFYLFVLKVAFSNIIPEFITSYLCYLLDPGNSLKPIRAFISYLSLFSVAWICYHCKRKVLLYRISISSVMLICFTWSNDYSLPSLLGVLLVLVLNRVKLSEIIKIILIFVLISLVFLSLISDFNYHSFIDYNFNGVRKDQWWYFIPYGDRVFFLTDLVNVILVKTDNGFYCNLYPLILTIILSISYFFSKNLKYGYCSVLLLVNFLGGAIASVGGHLTHYYFFNFVICSYLITLYLAMYIISSFIISKLEKRQLEIKYFDIAIVCIILIICVSIILSGVRYNHRINKFINSHAGFTYVDSFGGYLSNEYSEYIDFVKVNLKNQKFVEEYYGLASAYLNVKPVWKVDSVIHVLGNKLRLDSERKIDSVDYVITTRRLSEDSWQSWSFTQNYWFYKKVLQEFKPVYHGPLTIIWKRYKDNGVSLSKSNCTVNQNSKSYMINDSRKGFYDVKLTYKIHSSRILLLAQNNISRYGNFFASLDTVASSMKIPVFYDGKSNSFEIMILPFKKRSTVELVKCEAIFYNATSDSIFYFN